MRALRTAAPVLLVALLLVLAAVLLPDGAPPRRAPAPSATATATAAPGEAPPLTPQVAVLDAGGGERPTRAGFDALNRAGVRDVVLGRAAEPRTRNHVLLVRGGRERVARTVARLARVRVERVPGRVLDRLGSPEAADVVVLVGRPATG